MNLKHMRYAGLAFVALSFGMGMQYLPEAAETTMSRLQLDIERYYRRNNAYPNILDDLCRRGTLWPPCTYNDPFGQRYSYSRVPGGYKLYSNGWDRLPNTKDDILPKNRWGRCEFVWTGTEWRDVETMAVIDPVDAAGSFLSELDADIWSFYLSEKRYPKSIGELGRRFGDWGTVGSDRLVDPWGEPYFYSPRESTGYDLFSKGPDRMQYTADDIPKESMSMRCTWVQDGGRRPDESHPAGESLNDAGVGERDTTHKSWLRFGCSLAER